PVAPASMPAPLIGSRVSLQIEHSKPLPAPAPGEAGYSGFVRRALGVETLPDGLEADLREARWTFTWTLAQPTTFRVSLEDAHGVRSADDLTLSFDAVADAEPTATVTEPPQDEAVLP